MNNKKLIANIVYVFAFLSILYYLLLVPEPTNKQLMYFIFHNVAIIILSIQKNNQ
jgi:uncharacterized membrane protein